MMYLTQAGFSPEGKMAGAWYWPFTSINRRG